MNKNTVLNISIGLLMGVILTMFIAKNAINNQNNRVMQVLGITSESPAESDTEGIESDVQEINWEEDETTDMEFNLSGKSGDDFDKAFIDAMIIHHQTAIDMAAEASENAKHQEIKKMAEQIMSTQAGEIEDLEKYKKDWGYDDN